MTYINTKAMTLALLAASSAALLCPASAELIPRTDLSYDIALPISTGAVDCCKARGDATGVVVLDRGGNVMISLRADNAGLHTVENARRKAYTSLTFKITTSTFIEEMKTKPFRREQTNLPSVIAIDGGVPIKMGNDVIAGVGLSGSPGVDEECINAGLEKVKQDLQ